MRQKGWSRVNVTSSYGLWIASLTNDVHGLANSHGNRKCLGTITEEEEKKKGKLLAKTYYR